MTLIYVSLMIDIDDFDDENLVFLTNIMIVV